MRKTLLTTILLLAWLALPTSAQEDALTFTGELNDETWFVEIPLTIDEAGTTLIADARVVGGDLDTLLLLVDEDDVIVGENDDRAPDDLTSLLVYPSARPGDYTLVMTRFALEDGTSSGAYELLVELTPDETALAGIQYNLSAADLTEAGYPSDDPREPAPWTLLVYLAGDNNLESSLLADFEELERAGGSDETVRVVALLDRSPEYATTSGDWSGARVYEVGPDATSEIDSTPLFELGAVNTANGEALAQFLTWGVRNYPAEQTIVALGGRGESWRGSLDDATEGDSRFMSTAEMARAFERALAESGQPRFELLIHDSDLMSSAEYFAFIQPYFNFAIAPADVLIDPAIDLQQLIQSLRALPDRIDIEALSRSLVDTYIERDVIGAGAPDATFLSSTLTDLRAFEELVTALDEFADVVLSAPNRYMPLVADARQFAYTYTEFLGVSERINLKNFMTLIASISENNALRTAAVNVLNVLEDSFVYGRGGRLVTALDAFYGIYFPEDILNLDLAYFVESPFNNWDAMLRAFFNDQQNRIWSPTVAFD